MNKDEEDLKQLIKSTRVIDYKYITISILYTVISCIVCFSIKLPEIVCFILLLASFVCLVKSILHLLDLDHYIF